MTWFKKIQNIATTASELSNIEYDESFNSTINNLAVIESVAYHSATFGSNYEKILHSMPSSQLVKKFVHDYAMERVRKNEAMVFVWRGAKFWNITEEKNVIIRKVASGQNLYWEKEIIPMAKFLVNKLTSKQKEKKQEKEGREKISEPKQKKFQSHQISQP